MKKGVLPTFHIASVSLQVWTQAASLFFIFKTSSMSDILSLYPLLAHCSCRLNSGSNLFKKIAKL